MHIIEKPNATPSQFGLRLLQEKKREMGELIKSAIDVIAGKQWLMHEAVEICELKEGDHVFAVRAAGIYTHHGIYIGNARVIHFLNTKRYEDDCIKTHCQTCGYKENEHLGLVETCLDCFLSKGRTFAGTKLYLYLYGVPKAEYKRHGSLLCTTMEPKPSHQVVKTAKALMENGFGEYDLVFNNCEVFATFCKTGKGYSSQVDFVTSTALKTGAISMVIGVAATVALIRSFIAKKKKDERRENPPSE